MDLQVTFGRITSVCGPSLIPGCRAAGVPHWLMVYKDAQRFKGAFSSLLVYRLVDFRLRPNAPNLQNWVYFGISIL